MGRFNRRKAVKLGATLGTGLLLSGVAGAASANSDVEATTDSDLGPLSITDEDYQVLAGKGDTAVVLNKTGLDQGSFSRSALSQLNQPTAPEGSNQLTALLPPALVPLAQRAHDTLSPFDGKQSLSVLVSSSPDIGPIRVGPYVITIGAKVSYLGGCIKMTVPNLAIRVSEVLPSGRGILLADFHFAVWRQGSSGCFGLYVTRNIIKPEQLFCTTVCTPSPPSLKQFFVQLVTVITAVLVAIGLAQAVAELLATIIALLALAPLFA